MNLHLFVCCLCIGPLCGAETYEEIAAQLKTASEKSEIHRLKSLSAQFAIQRLEDGGLTKTEQKKMHAEAVAYCSDVQLGSMDIWYGKAVVSWGRLLLHDGKYNDAREAMLEQAEVLQNIEKNLTANGIPISAISPVAGCRYVLGESYRLEYESSQTLDPVVKALRHFYNIYIKYGDSPWGEKAQGKAEEMQGELERRGKQVRIDLGPHKDVFVANKFRLGARFVSEERYEDAVEPIETAVNYFPETGRSVQALRNLAVCKQALGDYEQAYAIAEYCCERFASDTNAPLAVLGLGRRAVDEGHEEQGEQLFDLYLNFFPEHEKRSDILSWFAWKEYKADELTHAVKFFQALEDELRRTGQTDERLEKAVYIQATTPASPVALNAFIAEFPESPRVASALSKKAQAELVAGDCTTAFATLEKLEADFPDTTVSKRALAGLIVAAVEEGRFDIAEQVLARMLEEKQSYGLEVYLATGDGLLAAEQYHLAEKAYAAVSMNQRAWFGMASCQFGRSEYEESFQTLEKILHKFPNAALFYDIRLMQARSLVQLHRMDEAVAAYSDAAAHDFAITLEMAGVLTDPEDKLAAYQRIALLADPRKREHRPLIAESIVLSLPLSLELGKFELALGSCAQFQALFPEHKKLPTIGKYRKEAEHALAN